MKGASERQQVFFAALEPFVASAASRLAVKRSGHSIIRSAGVPKPVVLVDTREREPLVLFEKHPNWFSGRHQIKLDAGDYSVDGMKGLLALERKSLADVFACSSPSASRERFINQCVRLARLRWRAILVQATLEDVKRGMTCTDIHPNAVCGTLDAVEAKFGIPVIYSSTDLDLATERAGSWLSKHFTYWWLEEHGHGRVLIDTDGL